MMFRRKLLAVFALTVFLSVTAVAWLVSEMTRRAFGHSDDERTAALVAEFQREFNRQSDEVAQQVESIARSEAANRMALALNRAVVDSGPYFELAKATAENDRLDFLEFVASDGSIISSAQWPAKFGYSEEAFSSFAAALKQGAFLKQETLPDGTALGLFAVRATQLGEHPVYVIGGRRLDKEFLSGLDLPTGMRALLYQNRGEHFSPDLLIDPSVSSTGDAHFAQRFEPLVVAVRRYKQEMAAVIAWSRDQADDEVFHAIPLFGASSGPGADRPLTAILLVGNSRRNYVELKRHIRSAALLAGGGGILLAIVLSSWAAAWVTRPLEKLAQAAQQVAAGNWNAHVEISGRDEPALLAESFNRMTAELITQKERLVQAERVAAWRELARRLAHELKNPLFPLQLTVENLLRAREQSPEQFDEVLRESSQTVLAEISNLKGIIGRFSEFSKMPQPHLQPLQVNDVIAGVMQLFQAQLGTDGKIKSELQLDSSLAPISADADLLHRAISNLVLNAIDAMPDGGTLTLRTRGEDEKIRIEVADTGSGLTAEQCEQIFIPYYTSKQHGTGLGLAIVQSVVSDHGGTIHVQSDPGKGATFVIELPRVSMSSIGDTGRY
jgi:two-component system, NtrC family, nitrogen regulation sensor histidine kinase NtrY